MTRRRSASCSATSSTEWERKAGHKPDILHLWAWAYHPKQIQRWGEYGGADYDLFGGQPAFKEAIADVQNNLGVAMSLYINATLCRKDIPIGERLADKALQLPDGKPFIRYPDTYCMCHATPEWIEQQIQTYQRLVRETGAKMLYVDQQATVQNIVNKTSCVCFHPGHGHPVPNHVNETDNRFIRALREAVPGEVALYGEFPYTDTTTQFYDSAIHYYFHRGGGLWSSPIFDAETTDGTDEVALNLYRFMFPKLMHLDLPLGIAYDTWHPLKFTFFNGEAIYDSIWQLDESRGHAFMIRAYELKKRFKDCFASDTPEMLVPTERAAVHANRFPGKGRTLWTLYNARPTTVRGTILAVPHQEEPPIATSGTTATSSPSSATAKPSSPSNSARSPSAALPKPCKNHETHKDNHEHLLKPIRTVRRFLGDDALGLAIRGLDV